MKKNGEKEKTVIREEVEQNAAEEPNKAEAETKFDVIDRAEMTDAEYIGALELKLGEAYKEVEDIKALVKRVQADFDNFRKRNNSIAQDMREMGQSQVIEKLLAVLDNCDLARKYVQDEAALTGFNMMEAQILAALDSFGLKEIEAEGKEFDAKLMNAVEREKDEQNAGKVTEVMLKGYTLRGNLLRAASVKVGYWE